MSQGQVRFSSLHVDSNATGWGPNPAPSQMDNWPHPNYAVAGLQGKIIDWTGMLRFSGKYSQGGSSYAYGPGGREEDHDKFEMVGGLPKTNKPQSKFNQRFRQQQQRRTQQQQQQQQQQGRTKDGPHRRPPHQSRSKRLPWRHRPQWGRWGQQKEREASIQLKTTWIAVEEMDFPRMQKLSWPLRMASGADRDKGDDVASAGILEAYDRNNDRISYRSSRELLRTAKALYSPPKTTDDLIIRELLRTHRGVKVFATDRVIAALMACTRSVQPFHIVATRFQDKLFLEKREDSRLDQLTVNETASEPPAEDAQKALNTPKQLSQEATLVNHQFVQQVTKHDGKDNVQLERAWKMVMDVDDGEAPVPENTLPKQAFKYRKFIVDESKNLEMIVRCKIDCVQSAPSTDKTSMLVNATALTEWDPSQTSNANWQQLLDTQFAAVLATELQNNTFRLSRWVISCLLAGVDLLKLGFVTRQNFRDPSRHTVVHVAQFRPNEFANNINLNMENSWGMLNYILTKCLEQPQGDYLLIKDPNKPVIRLFSVPPDEELDAEDDEENDEDDDDDEDDDEAGPPESPAVITA